MSGRTNHCAGSDDTVKYWEIIADNLSEAGMELGFMSPAIDSNGRTIWIADNCIAMGESAQNDAPLSVQASCKAIPDMKI